MPASATLILAIVALVLAGIALIQSRGTALLAWAVVILAFLQLGIV